MRYCASYVISYPFFPQTGGQSLASPDFEMERDEVPHSGREDGVDKENFSGTEKEKDEGGE